VFIDRSSGRRRPIPDDLLTAFIPVADDGEVRRILGLDRARPDGGAPAT
jgi:hypothetical protein